MSTSFENLAVTLSEREFLIKLAVDRYNLQYGKAFTIDQFDCKSINPDYGFNYGYEVYTVFEGDYLRLRMYFNLASRTFLIDYKVEVDITYHFDFLGDEVFVTIGEVDRWYKDSGTYDFLWMYPDYTRLNVLITEDKKHIIATQDNKDTGFIYPENFS